ncbi:hypothetical protein ACFL3A_14890 [Pseudomonadota bacterium]
MPRLPRHIDPNSRDNETVSVLATSVLKWTFSAFSLIATTLFVVFINNGL